MRLLVYENHWVSSDSWKARMAPWREVQAVGMHGATVIICSLSVFFQCKKNWVLQKRAGERKDSGSSSGYLQPLSPVVDYGLRLWLLDCSSVRGRSTCLCTTGKMVPYSLHHLHELPAFWLPVKPLQRHGFFCHDLGGQ